MIPPTIPTDSGISILPTRFPFESHARNLASAAGANQEQLDRIVQKMIEENNISLNRAKELLEQI